MVALQRHAFVYGDGRSAVEHPERGLRLSPLDTQAFSYLMFLGAAHYVNRTYEEAVIWGRKSLSLQRTRQTRTHPARQTRNPLSARHLYATTFRAASECPVNSTLAWAFVIPGFRYRQAVRQP
jgi:hypothetical protein